MKAFSGPDSLGVYLTGGSLNTDSASSLGGAISNQEVAGIAAIVTKPLPGIILENASPLNGEGEGILRWNNNETFSYTPPDGLEGNPARLDPDCRATIRGRNTNKSIRVYRRKSGNARGEMRFEFKRPYNGVFGMEDITDAQRQAGAIHYRAVMLYNHSPNRIVNISIWQTILDWTQASFSFGLETAV
jgi:hypothetical protein